MKDKPNHYPKTDPWELTRHMKDKPTHYPKIDPWELTRHMKTSGNPLVDTLRSNMIKYSFRKKKGLKKMIRDLQKAINCAEAAKQELRKIISEAAQKQKNKKK